MAVVLALVRQSLHAQPPLEAQPPLGGTAAMTAAFHRVAAAGHGRGWQLPFLAAATIAAAAATAAARWATAALLPALSELS